MDSGDISHMVLRANVRQMVTNCRGCGLCDVGNGPIPFRGPSPSKVVIVGEAPGRVEDAIQKPFVGPSGQLAQDRLRSAGIDPDTVAWLNVVSCFPNRTPTRREVDACRDNLLGQLRLLDPYAILVLGGVALSAWWPDIRIGDIRGSFWQAEIRKGDPINKRPWAMATWHPAAVLRNGVGASRDKEMTADVARFRGILAIENMSYLTKFRYVANLRCIMCGQEACHWIDHDNTVNDDIVGALGYCQKHWDFMRGIAGQGKGAKGAGKKTALTPKKLRARKSKDVVVQEGLL